MISIARTHVKHLCYQQNCTCHRAMGVSRATRRHQRLALSELPHGAAEHYAIQSFSAEERPKGKHVEPIHGSCRLLQQHSEQRFSQRERQQQWQQHCEAMLDAQERSTTWVSSGFSRSYLLPGHSSGAGMDYQRLLCGQPGDGVLGDHPPLGRRWRQPPKG